MSEPYTLAVSCVERDREFNTLDELARFLVHLRDQRDTPRPEFSFTPCRLSRGGTPELWCLSARLLDGGEKGHGSFLGYAIEPAGPEFRRFEPSRLSDAIDRVYARRLAA